MTTEKINTNDNEVPEVAANAVLQVTEEIPKDAKEVKGYDFNNPFDYNKLMSSYLTTGFQSTNLGKAIEQINLMLENDVKIFLGYTSNLVSSGSRDILRFLCQHKMVDVVVSSAGGIEEDFIKCLAPTLLGDFSLKGKNLRLKGLNRIGNLLVPNSNYVKFEEFMNPILDEMLETQKRTGEFYTPSSMIKLLGEKIDNPESIYYWCARNDIPVFCPSLTDGSIGDMIYFHSYKNPGLVLDIAKDIRLMNDQALNAKKTGMLILGGGLVKHHICNANLMRNGADYSVFVNTAQEFDGSDSGAKPDEAVSWGKIKIGAEGVKVCVEATIVLPLIVSQTFAKLKDFKRVRKD
eukprot:snap_masked-scaffold_48-processed-gene-1.101-mRNA-1 protein AED:0.02 eAED:0.02 QI:0/-1/0/1/-1/1/1/0/348